MVKRASILNIRVLSLLISLYLLPAIADAQFRSQADQESRVSQGLYGGSGSSFFFGLFDPARFQMRHSLSFSYQTFGNQGVSLGTYTNSMSYAFAENLNARADVSLSYSPYNTFSKGGGGSNNFGSIYLSRAEINYRPFENMTVQIQYRQFPYGTFYSSPFFYYSNPMFRDFND
ncbi:MAG: hypothetical protein WBH55_15420 [Bacteroidota bacterium]